MPGPDGNFSRCIGETQQAGGDGATQEEAQTYLQRVSDRAARLQEEQGLSPEEATRQAARELYDSDAAAAAKLRANRYQNLQKRVVMRDRMTTMAQDLGALKGTGEPDLVGAVRGQLVALLRPVGRSRDSVEHLTKQLRSRLVDALDRDLKKAGLEKVVRKGTLDDQWATELGELSRRDAGETDRVGMTGSKSALQIAEIIHGYMNLSKNALNKQGAWIGDIAGYITRQTHDFDKIRRAGFAKWSADISGWLDHDRTFEGMADQPKFLRSVYADLLSGVHLKEGGRVGDKDPAFTGPANMAQKMSAERVLHFKDSPSWLAYNRTYGAGRPIEQVMGTLERSARAEALMTRFGTNPRGEFDQHVQWLKQSYKDSHPEAVRKLANYEKTLGGLFDRLDGTANIPEHEMAAKISSGLRLWQSMTKLGGVALSHISSLNTIAAELKYNGVGLLERYGVFFSSFVPKTAEGRQLADMMLAGHEGSRDSMVSRFSWEDGSSAWAARTAGTFFKYTGLEALLASRKSGVMRLMSRYLGDNVGRSFDELSPELQRGLPVSHLRPGGL